jgi:hypothetical protein
MDQTEDLAIRMQCHSPYAIPLANDDCNFSYLSLVQDNTTFEKKFY